MKCDLCGQGIIDIKDCNSVKVDDKVVTMCKMCNLQIEQCIKAEIADTIREVKEAIIKSFLEEKGE